jgi:glycosyltransferase involved in cell wall biosynthesis
MTAHQSPLVSVIIPTFNAAAYVAQAIASAQCSREVPLEIIVIDDESTDGTWSVLETFEESIRKVRQTKGGPYKARNLGARLARGEWLAFLDADDEWAPGKLARQMDAADHGHAALIYTDRYNFGDCRRVKERQSDCVQLWDGDVFEPLLLDNFITLSSVLIHRHWFDQLGGFCEAQTGVQDWDLWLRYASAGGNVKLIREPLTGYRIHAEQMSHDHDRRANERLAVVRRALRSRRGKDVHWKIGRQALANVWEIGAWQAAPSHRAKAVYWFLRAARHWPWNVRLYKGIANCCLGRV